jgi:hypothetical protein
MDLAIFVRRVEHVLEFDSAVYPTERDKMMFVKQYLVGNAAAVLD